MLTRFSDWPERLTRFLADCQFRKFQYGHHDCCLFVADAVLAIAGQDIASEFRGKYRTRREALRMAKAYSGYGSVRSLLLKALDSLPSVNPAMAQRGDIVLLKRERDYSLGIVALDGKHAVKAAATGIMSLDLSVAAKAWHV